MPHDRFWIVQSISKEGEVGYVYDKRDGLFFVPRYTSRRKALERNRLFFVGRPPGRYRLRRVTRERIERFEREMNERNKTAHAKAMRKRDDEVAKAASDYLERQRDARTSTRNTGSTRRHRQ
jgi:hypothetical protein